MTAKESINSSLFRIPGIMQIQLFARIIQLEIDTKVTLDRKSQLFGIRPFAVVPAAVLAVAKRLFPIYDTHGVVFLPQMLQGLSFAGQSLVDSFFVKIPVEEMICLYTRLLVKHVSDAFIRDICR